MRHFSIIPGHGGAALTLLLAVAFSSCRLDVQHLEVGPAIDLEAYHALQPGHDDRGSILAALGPPHRVWYTLDEEVLEYRHGGHRGTDFSFLFTSENPLTHVFAGSQNLINVLLPFEQPAEFDPKGLDARTAERAANATVPVRVTDVMSLLNRRVRYDIVLLQLDRDTHHLRQKQFLRAVPATGADEVARTSLLRDAD